MRAYALVLAGLLLVVRVPDGAAAPEATAPPAARVQTNDNTRPAGFLRAGALTLALETRLAEWHPDGDASPGTLTQSFAEVGGPARIPGPLVRVPAGTTVSVTMRNTLADTLLIYGLHERPVAGTPNSAPLVFAPGATHAVRFRLDAPGTYFYWGTTTHRAHNFRTGLDGQLSGAIVVDSAGTARAHDRVLVMGMWSDTVHRAGTLRKRVLGVVNGRSWPHTEQLTYTVGDTVRWRVINASADLHPMHLHGFYFRVTSRGDGVRDTLYRGVDGNPAGDLVVTEGMSSPQTISMSWVPERTGNWLFHCHVPEHFEARGALGVARAANASDAHHHARGGMNGLVLGIAVRPRAGQVARVNDARARTRLGSGFTRRMRLLVRPTVGSSDATPLYAYALHEGGAEPPPDTGLAVSSVLDLVRGQPVWITVINRLREPTAVHWHGIELDSYYDGVPGFSGVGGRVTPLIAPGDSFDVRFTPPRSGSFIYHTHASEVRQQTAGLAGALVVRDAGTQRDRATDIPIVITSPTEFELNRRTALMNGRSSPEPLTMTVGRTYRFRFMMMSVPRAALTPVLLLGERGDSLASWRHVAKDAIELSGLARAERPARGYIRIGETMDYEVTPTVPGAMRLEVRFGLPPGSPMSGRDVVTASSWAIRVVAPDGHSDARRPQLRF